MAVDSGGGRISGIGHVTLSVRDLLKSLDFYTGVLECRLIARWNAGAYLLAGELWITLIEDDAMQDEVSAEYTHVALAVSTEDFEALRERIEGSGAEIWQEDGTPGSSLYFTDPNGHKLELSTSNLEDRLRADRQNPPEGMQFFL